MVPLVVTICTFSMACNLLAYLLDKPFTYEFKRKKGKVTFRKYMTDSKLLIGLMPWGFSFIAHKTQRNDSLCYKVVTNPRRNYHFKGTIFVLTNAGTFSAASFVAAYLKKLTPAILIGQETGGNEIGTNAMLFAFLTLPETKILLRLPLYRISHGLSIEHTGKGVMPAIEINYTVADKLAKIDKELEKIYDLLKQENN